MPITNQGTSKLLGSVESRTNPGNIKQVNRPGSKDISNLKLYGVSPTTGFKNSGGLGQSHVSYLSHIAKGKGINNFKIFENTNGADKTYSLKPA